MHYCTRGGGKVKSSPRPPQVQVDDLTKGGIHTIILGLKCPPISTLNSID